MQAVVAAVEIVAVLQLVQVELAAAVLDHKLVLELLAELILVVAVVVVATMAHHHSQVVMVVQA
jgi:hypothetical protein